MHVKSNYLATLLIGGAAAVAIAAAPTASAQPCFDAGSATQCQTPGNAQITTNAPVGAPSDMSVYGPFFTYDRGRR